MYIYTLSSVDRVCVRVCVCVCVCVCVYDVYHFVADEGEGPLCDDAILHTLSCDGELSMTDLLPSALLLTGPVPIANLLNTGNNTFIHNGTYCSILSHYYYVI